MRTTCQLTTPCTAPSSMETPLACTPLHAYSLHADPQSASLHAGSLPCKPLFSIQTPPPKADPPPKAHPPLNRQTPVKTLPSPILRMWSVTMNAWCKWTDLKDCNLLGAVWLASSLTLGINGSYRLEFHPVKSVGCSSWQLYLSSAFVLVWEIVNKSNFPPKSWLEFR